MELPGRVERGRRARGGRGRCGPRARRWRGPEERPSPPPPERERERGGGRGCRRRARGRGETAGPSWGQPQEQQDEDDLGVKEDYDQSNEFSRRRIVSNWDRYKTEEKEQEDNDEPPRGTDFNVLLSNAGDSFAQFRFAEETEWELEAPSSKQISPLFVDCQALAHSLQELPLYLRLNLEAELVQTTPPAELPQVTLKNMHDGPSKFSQFRAQDPMLAVHTIPVSSVPEDTGKQTFDLSLKPVTQAARSGPPTSQQAPDMLEDELEFLLQLETPVSKNNEAFSVGVQDAEAPCNPKIANISADSTDAEATDKINPETTKKLDPEEDLEDWLDSIIS